MQTFQREARVDRFDEGQLRLERHHEQSHNTTGCGGEAEPVVENADALDQLDLLFGETVIGQIGPLLASEL